MTDAPLFFDEADEAARNTRTVAYHEFLHEVLDSADCAAGLPIVRSDGTVNWTGDTLNMQRFNLRERVARSVPGIKRQTLRVRTTEGPWNPATAAVKFDKGRPTAKERHRPLPRYTRHRWAALQARYDAHWYAPNPTYRFAVERL